MKTVKAYGNAVAPAGGNMQMILKRQDPRELVRLAQHYTKAALKTIVGIMENEELPAAVRLRAAELVLERGYGKAAQAILVGQDGTLPEGSQMIPLVDRIIALRQAKDLGAGTDIELLPSEAREEKTVTAETALEELVG